MLETRLLLGVAALVAVAAAAGGCVWYGYDWGSDNVYAEWNKVKQEAADKLAEEKESDRVASYAIAKDLQTQLDAAESRYAKLSTKYTKALGSRFECPASGFIGDVVLPADLTDSLFISEKPAGGASRPAASRASEAVR